MCTTLHFILIILMLLIEQSTCYGKVDPPNYNFSLDTLADFYPNKRFAKEEFEKKFGKSENIKSTPPYQIYQFEVAHIRYKFPVLVQIKEGIITDFFARLPNYFLHDVFHQSLINRLGKQDTFKNVNGDALYIWNGPTNEGQNFKHTYASTCTITCFPLFYAGEGINYRSDSSFKSIDQIINQH